MHSVQPAGRPPQFLDLSELDVRKAGLRGPYSRFQSLLQALDVRDDIFDLLSRELLLERLGHYAGREPLYQLRLWIQNRFAQIALIRLNCRAIRQHPGAPK